MKPILNEIKRMQQLAGIITESAFDKVKQVLINKGYPEDKITTYCNDLESYGDESDYENISDEEVVMDFEQYFGELNEALSQNLDDIINNGNYVSYQNANTLPQTPGVYFWLLNENAFNLLHNAFQGCNYEIRNINGQNYRLMYVGMATNLRSRVKNDHMSGDLTGSTFATTHSSLLGLTHPKDVFDFLTNQGQTLPGGVLKTTWKQAVRNFIRNNYIVGYIQTPTTQDAETLENQILYEQGRCDLVYNIDDNDDFLLNNPGVYAAIGAGPGGSRGIAGRNYKALGGSGGQPEKSNLR